MHTEEIKEIKSTQTIHIFKCDNCNTDLGTSIEYDDGYYETYGKHTAGPIINMLYDLDIDEMYLCDRCYESFIHEVRENLQKIIEKYQH